MTSRPYRSMRIKSRPFHRPVGSQVRVLRRNIPFVHRLKYLDVISGRTRKCRIHIEINKKRISFRTLNTARCRFTSVGLSAKIKLTIHEALIRPLILLPRLQNYVFRKTGNFPRRTPVRDLHTALRKCAAGIRNYARSK